MEVSDKNILDKVQTQVDALEAEGGENGPKIVAEVFQRLPRPIDIKSVDVLCDSLRILQKRKDLVPLIISHFDEILMELTDDQRSIRGKLLGIRYGIVPVV